MKNLLYLQLFAEGSAAGSGSSGAEGADSGVAHPGEEASVETVVYGKPSGEVANPKGKAAESPETKEARFQELIKGEFKEEYAKRTQAIIDDRFKKYKGTEERLQSIDPILKTLADKYGADANDIEALKKAIDEDDSFFQKAAIDRGLTVKQYKEVRALERQNEELLAQQQQQKQQEEVDKIFAQWAAQSKEFAEKYQIENFDFDAEMQNPEFSRLLGSGVTVEGAYKAVHFDEMVGGAMAHTAAKVKEGIVNSVNSRAQRPSEGAVSSHPATTFKTDVNALTKADREEIERRAARGEIITF